MSTANPIKEEIEAELAWDDRVDASKIEVSVSDGVVTLKGTASNLQEKAAAEDDARSIRGTRKILNTVAIVHPPSFEVPTDVIIKKNAENSFVANSDLDSSQIQVSVDEGKVKLDGRVGDFGRRLRQKTSCRSSVGSCLWKTIY